MDRKLIDLIVISFLPLLGVAYSLIFKDQFIGKSLWGGAVFILPSVIYLSLREKKNWTKLALGTLIFGGLYGFFFEFMAEFNYSYQVLNPVFPKIFSVLSLDNVLGHMMMALLILTFYQHFLRSKLNNKIPSFLFLSLIIGFSFVGVMLFLFFNRPSALYINYEYAAFGFLALFPVIYLFIRRPWNRGDLVKVIPYFFVLFLVIELVAVNNSWWIYPGEYYLLWVNILGFRFPFEELFFWMIFYAPFIISCYELFLEPRKEPK